MSPAPKRISIPEADARRLTLAQAVEASDMQGKLLSTVEREAIDRVVSQSARAAPVDPPAQVESLLRERAAQVLRVVDNRSPALASLQHSRPAARWLAIGVPLAAVLIGGATDRIANPHRVDLLSLPLLTIVLWNLAVYVALLAAWLMRRPGKKPAGPSPVAHLARRLAAWQPRVDALHARVTATFAQHWYAATAALQAQRVRKVLHLAAAGWALGVVLSLFTRGLVVEYRVGWESTFLNVEQVHAILRVLLLPVLGVFQFEPFSIQDIAALRFSEGTAPTTNAAAGARWVYLYAGLLALVVIAPRLLLALLARWREWRLAAHVTLDLDSAYYRRLVAMTDPARIQLGLIAQHDDQIDALLRVLRPRAQAFDAGFPASGGSAMTLISASSGESLEADRIESTHPAAPVPPAAAAGSGWAGQTWARLRRTADAARLPSADAARSAAQPSHDAVLVVFGDAADLDAALPLVGSLGRPALLLGQSSAATSAQREADLARWRTQVKAWGLDAEMLDFDSFARCWVQQPVLLDAIGRCVPAAKKEGFARLLETQMQRHRARFSQSMAAIARQLIDGAREVEAVTGAPSSVTRLIRPSERQADSQARADATAALSARLQRSARQTQDMLLRLHGLEGAAGELIEQTFDEAFRHTAPVNARQAGMAGAATGAATGASVDLMVGGLTLGAAAALGALVGGSAALAGAVWKNRASPTGAATIQLSDEMLHALTGAALLRYLSIVHLEGGAEAIVHGDAARNWTMLTQAAVARHHDPLAGHWTGARQTATPPPVEALGRELEAIAREVLHTLYPASPLA